MDVRERFLRAVEHIEAHLFEPVALADAAKCADLSPYHFSRLFRVLTGEPFGAYLRRRRLTWAAGQLLDKQAKVPLIQLAFDCQYDSQEAFTRAFKRAFWLTPGAYRKRRPRTRMGWRERLDAQTLEHLTEVLDMEPEIRERDSFIVVGMRERYDNDTKHQIPALWGRFVPRRDEIPHRVPEVGYGVCLNGDMQTGSLDYIAGAGVDKVERLPEGMIAEVIPRQTYAVFTHHLHSKNLHAELQPTMRWIWSTWLPSSSYEPVPGPDFELYPPGFNPENGTGYLEIWIPVRPRA
jgi:AraC family transcriptional regulator